MHCRLRRQRPMRRPPSSQTLMTPSAVLRFHFGSMIPVFPIRAQTCGAVQGGGGGKDATRRRCARGGALIVSAARSWQSARLAVGEARQLFIIITPGLSANMKTKRQSRLSIRSEEPVREQRTCWARYEIQRHGRVDVVVLRQRRRWGGGLSWTTCPTRGAESIIPL